MYIYYLLYKLNNNKTYWIVKTYNNQKEIKEDLNYLDKDEDEEYLIVKRKIKDENIAKLELERKQFRFKVFLFKKSDSIIKLNKINKINKINKLSIFYKLKKSAKVVCL